MSFWRFIVKVKKCVARMDVDAEISGRFARVLVFSDATGEALASIPRPGSAGDLTASDLNDCVDLALARWGVDPR